MKKYLIASHGHFASGLKSSIKILTGKENIETIDAYLDGSEDQSGIDTKIEQFIKSLNSDDVGIIFTDLMGGSVNREVMLKTDGIENILVISSVNLPIVMSVLLDTDEHPSEEHIQKLISECPVQVSKISKSESDISDDDFLS